MTKPHWSFYIDRGGTFTDCIGYEQNSQEVRVTKVLSSDYAPLLGIRRLLGLNEDEHIPQCTVRMGTTLATNALLEKKGVDTALIITSGFRDILYIGTQARADIFSLEIDEPPVLPKIIEEVGARLSSDGDTIQKPETEQIRNKLIEIREQNITSLAVVILHSYIDGTIEKEIESLAKEIGFKHISISHEVVPEIGLVARANTTVVDAYLTPLLKDYVTHLSSQLEDSQLLIMQSSGGLCESHNFRGRNAVLSGPAGGVVAASHVANIAQVPQAIGFDMGGTSTDVSRIAGEPTRNWETDIAGIKLRAPMMEIHTVAAGGGSICLFTGDRLTVGPDSAGAIPGPLCYGNSEAKELTLTDVNLCLGRILPDRFPFPIDTYKPAKALERLASLVPGRDTIESVAEGFFEVANEVMAQAIKKVSISSGYDVRDHALVVFGGAGGQHAAAIARKLDIDLLLFPPFSGVLSAYGMALADVDWHASVDAKRLILSDAVLSDYEADWADLKQRGEIELTNQKFEASALEHIRRIDLRYKGSETTITLKISQNDDTVSLRNRFENQHKKTYGYIRNKHPIEVVALRHETRGKSQSPALKQPETANIKISDKTTRIFFNGRWIDAEVYHREHIPVNKTIHGPAIILEATSTIIVEPDFSITHTDNNILSMKRTHKTKNIELSTSDLEPIINPIKAAEMLKADPVRLEVYNHRFMSIAERMGQVLQRTALSVNIRERLDFSCALFDSNGELIANAPHIPVHLGAMSQSVKAIVKQHQQTMKPGDVFVTNDPAEGGSHLPDITVVTPVFSSELKKSAKNNILFFVASRGHHEDVGGITPGSMPPFSRNLQEEGIVLKGEKLVDENVLQEEKILQILSSGPYPARRPKDNLADMQAQIAANRAGTQLLLELIETEGVKEVISYMGFVQDNAAQRVQKAISNITDGQYTFEDSLDDGTPIRLTLKVSESNMLIDFTGTSPAVEGNLNAPSAVTVAAVIYVLRALVGEVIPLNSGCIRSVKLVIPEGSILCPPPDAAVAGGNVETSQRVVDVLLGAIGRAAASQGTMNNLTFGNESFGYYETIAGGAGATPFQPGRSGIHTHMTNTRITDPEILEARFPVRLHQFAIRPNSGGRGVHDGGHGLIREIEALIPLRFSIISERRNIAPFGLAGAAAGAKGINWHNETKLPAKTTFIAQPKDRILIETPGGGGWGPTKKGA